MDLQSQQEEQLHESLANRLTYVCKPVKTQLLFQLGIPDGGCMQLFAYEIRDATSAGTLCMPL